MAKIERVYRHYKDLEEFHAGMWKVVRGEDRKAFIKKASDLMARPHLFKAAMSRAVKEWPVSCKVALSCEASNRIAWLGHAGCCIATGSPEEATRAGWHNLNQSEQDDANKVAGEVLKDWDAREAYEFGSDLFSFLGDVHA